jgi:hypothetical protein
MNGKNNGWSYYEYADDLLARRKENSGGVFDIWVKGQWVPSYDATRFAYTAVKIDDPAAYAKENPNLAAAFADEGVAP